MLVLPLTRKGLGGDGAAVLLVILLIIMVVTRKEFSRPLEDGIDRYYWMRACTVLVQRSRMRCAAKSDIDQQQVK